jgi:hypothetical protein
MPPTSRQSTAKKRPAPASRTAETPPRKKYRQVSGARYDDAALVLADKAVASHGKVTLDAAKAVHQAGRPARAFDAWDGPPAW